MRRLVTAVPALALCLVFLQGASRVSPVYFVDGWTDPSRPTATFAFDRSLHEFAVSPDIVVAARNSPQRLRLLGKPGGGLSFDAPGAPVAPCDYPWTYALNPSGSYYVCFQGIHATAVLYVYRTNGRRVAMRRVPNAATQNLHAVAFLDDDRLLFESYDPHCRDQSLSISIMSISGRFPPRPYFACANGIIPGSRRVAYLRGTKDEREYSLDGHTWTRGKLYGLDADDRAITDGSPLALRFVQLHPQGGIRSVSLGGLPKTI
jgi:hypothetical protein